MTKKILWFDCETTGLSPDLNDPVQIAGLIEIDGEIEGEFNIKTQPINYDTVDQRALDVNKLTLEEIKTYPEPERAHRILVDTFDSCVDKFNKKDKYYPAGYNVKFDIDFLAEWFKKLGDKYLGSWWNWRGIDPLPLLYHMDVRGEISLKNYQLGTVCEHYGIKLDAHDALSDIKATRQLCYRLEILR